MAQSKVIEKLLSNGVYADTPIYLKNKLRVFNAGILAVITINIFYDIVGLVEGYYAAVFITTVCLLLTLLSYWFIYLRKYNLSFHFVFWSTYFVLSGFTYIFGGANSSYYYFLFIPVACNIAFENRKLTLFYFLSSILLMFVNIYWFNHFEPYYAIEEWMSNFSYPNIFFASLLIYFGVRMFKEENLKYSNMVEEQKKVLEEKNQEITDSITYAKRIQSALIPSEEEFNSYFKESFVLFKPKDIVSGDFYWITKKDNQIFYATGDCTGHGVPGGFMTMLGISFLDEIVNEKNISQPSLILDSLREKIIHTLKQTGNSGESKDGMDITICRLDLINSSVTFSAANNSLYVLREGKLNEYKADKQPCGFYHQIKPFTQNEIKLNSGDSIITFTDGYADQFGGPKGKKFKYKQIEQLAVSLCNKKLSEQKKVFDNTFENWRGELEQVDDVCMLGIKI